MVRPRLHDIPSDPIPDSLLTLAHVASATDRVEVFGLIAIMRDLENERILRVLGKALQDIDFSFAVAT
jgi:hypothetical protein